MKIFIPPYNVSNGTINITGERQEVNKVANELKSIYERKVFILVLLYRIFISLVLKYKCSMFFKKNF